LAGADNGKNISGTGLSASSTIEEALARFEEILVDSEATEEQLNDTRYVTMRIAEFYKYENPIAPLCVLDLDQLPSQGPEDQARMMLLEEVEVDDMTDDATENPEELPEPQVEQEEPLTESETEAETLPIEEESEQNQEPNVEENNSAPEEIVQEP
jgi:hypothetical protein